MSAPALVGRPPEEALEALGELLAAEGTMLSAHVRATDAAPSLGALAAAGPRALAAPGEYALLVETIREGYLLHYSQGRVLAPDDPDLALLAGDYLYARGLERLAALGDLEAVTELADLVSLAAQCHAGSTDGAGPGADALWLAAAAAVGCGPSEAHQEAKRSLRAGSPEAVAQLAAEAADRAGRAGLRRELDRAAESIGFTRS